MKTFSLKIAFLFFFIVIIFVLSTNKANAQTPPPNFCSNPGQGSCNNDAPCGAGCHCSFQVSSCLQNCGSDQLCRVNCQSNSGWCINGTSGSAACFPPGTKISTPGNLTKNIEDVKVGDKVIGSSEDGKQTTNTVTQTYSPISNNLCSIKFTDGEDLDVTKGHPLFTQNGWKAIDTKEASWESPGVDVTRLTIGDFMKKETGEWKQIANISCKDEEVQTYNFTVDTNHTYYANGFLAHNKCNCTACYADDPSCIANMYTVTDFTVTRTSPTSATIDWNIKGGTCPGGGDVTIFIGTDQTQIANNCGFSSPASIPQRSCTYPDCGLPAGCDFAESPVTYKINADGKTVPVTKYDTGNILTANTVYYIKVISGRLVRGDTGKHGKWCSTGVNNGYISSCSIYPSSAVVGVGSTTTLSSTVNASSGISSVDYTGDSQYVTLNPTSSTASPYSTTVTGVAVTSPTTQVTSDVFLTGQAGTQCTATSTVTVTAPISSSSWWQVKDGDVTTNGDLQSAVPSGKFFGLNGSGGYPGVPAYGNTATGVTTSNVSSIGWMAQTSTSNPKNFDYQYFVNSIPAAITINSIQSIDQATIDGGTQDSTTGYYWYKFDGSSSNLDLSLDTPLDIGNKKVVLLVDSADFNINSSINLNDGAGFFMAVVGKNTSNLKGNINISSSLGGGSNPNLEGIYVADNSFSDETLQPGGNDSELWVRGSVVAYQGVNLQRDLGSGNTTTPGELFEYAPDQVMLFPKVLSTRKISWKEVAP